MTVTSKGNLITFFLELFRVFIFKPSLGVGLFSSYSFQDITFLMFLVFLFVELEHCLQNFLVLRCHFNICFLASFLSRVGRPMPCQNMVQITQVLKQESFYLVFYLCLALLQPYVLLSICLYVITVSHITSGLLKDQDCWLSKIHNILSSRASLHLPHVRPSISQSITKS